MQLLPDASYARAKCDCPAHALRTRGEGVQAVDSLSGVLFSHLKASTTAYGSK